MDNYTARKVIIIDKIDSRFIKQAVFVLKDNEVSIDSDDILNEAYDVLNRYECAAQHYTQAPKKQTLKHRFKKMLKALWINT